MTTTSVRFDNIFLIDKGGYRDLEVNGELDIEFVTENRWQIVGVKVELWTDDQPYTRKLYDTPEPEVDLLIRRRIMTSHSWCEHISEHIASEMKQDRNLERPTMFNNMVFT